MERQRTMEKISVEVRSGAARGAVHGRGDDRRRRERVRPTLEREGSEAMIEFDVWRGRREDIFREVEDERLRKEMRRMRKTDGGGRTRVRRTKQIVRGAES